MLLLAGVAIGADLRSQKTSSVDFDPFMQTLAQSKAAEVVKVGSYDDFEPIFKSDDPHGVALMMLGAFLIPLSQVLLWKNEG